MAEAHILVVDDAVENLLILDAILKGAGYDVTMANDGAEAIQCALEKAPDLILLDISMPMMDGFEVCERLKQFEGLREAPVLFISSRVDTDEKVRAFKSGGQDYITKPFEVDEVVARVRTHLQLRQLQVRLRNSLDELRQLETLRDSLVHMLVHDMRNELHAQRFSLELIRGCKDTEEAATDLDDAVSSNNYLSRLASDLLDVSRLESGKMPIDRRDTDIGELCKSVGATLARVVEAKDLRLKYDVTTSIIHCDPDLVGRVVGNLLHNAVKFTPSGGLITISCQALESGIVVSVEDTGPGIPEELVDRVFEKYEQGGSMRKYTSSGLGLTFCKLAVETHNGTIGVDSTLDRGSRFWFELPDTCQQAQ